MQNALKEVSHEKLGDLEMLSQAILLSFGTLRSDTSSLLVHPLEVSPSMI